MHTATRRRVLGFLSGGATATLTGCSSDAKREGPGRNEESPEADVVVGPDGDLRFEPAEIVIRAGDSVSWYFESAGHNVSCRPADSDTVVLPEGAEPFATYGPEESMMRTLPPGETYAHTFETPGKYVYVCVPHIRLGMVGRVTVEG